MSLDFCGLQKPSHRLLAKDVCAPVVFLSLEYFTNTQLYSDIPDYYYIIYIFIYTRIHMYVYTHFSILYYMATFGP